MSNSWICVDASLVIRLVADPADEAGRRLWEGWDADGRPVTAPTLLYYEVTNGLFQYQKLGLLTPGRSAAGTAGRAFASHLFVRASDAASPGSRTGRGSGAADNL